MEESIRRVVTSYVRVGIQHNYQHTFIYTCNSKVVRSLFLRVYARSRSQSNVKIMEVFFPNFLFAFLYMCIFSSITEDYILTEYFFLSFLYLLGGFFLLRVLRLKVYEKERKTDTRLYVDLMYAMHLKFSNSKREICKERCHCLNVTLQVSSRDLCTL